jgi:hypothetical protein
MLCRKTNTCFYADLCENLNPCNVACLSCICLFLQHVSAQLFHCQVVGKCKTSDTSSCMAFDCLLVTQVGSKHCGDILKDFGLQPTEQYFAMCL